MTFKALASGRPATSQVQPFSRLGLTGWLAGSSRAPPISIPPASAPVALLAKPNAKRTDTAETQGAPSLYWPEPVWVAAANDRKSPAVSWQAATKRAHAAKGHLSVGLQAASRNFIRQANLGADMSTPDSVRLPRSQSRSARNCMSPGKLAAGWLATTTTTMPAGQLLDPRGRSMVATSRLEWPEISLRRRIIFISFTRPRPTNNQTARQTVKRPAGRPRVILVPVVVGVVGVVGVGELPKLFGVEKSILGRHKQQLNCCLLM